MKNLLAFLIGCLVGFPVFSQNADSAQFYYNKGIEENSAKLFAVAAKDFDKAILWKPDFSEAYIANAKVNLGMKKIYEAVQNFTKANQLDPENTEVIQQLAVLYFNNRQYQQAMDFAQKCNCQISSRILGMSYYQLEDYGKAEKYLKQVVAADGQDADAAYTLGRTYLELENEKSAIVQFEKAISILPKNTWTYELGLIYFNQNDFKNSLRCFDLACNAGYNKTNDFYENYGFAQLYAGESENGIKTLTTLLERKPNNRELLNNIANALYETKKFNEALAYFTKLLELNPKDASSLFMAGMTFQKLGQKEKGQKICDSAIAMDPSLARYRQKKEMPVGL